MRANRPTLLCVRIFLIELPYILSLGSMKLSTRGEYALRALLVLGMNHGPQVVRIQTISSEQNIPKRFLEQILNEEKEADQKLSQIADSVNIQAKVA